MFSPFVYLVRSFFGEKMERLRLINNRHTEATYSLHSLSIPRISFCHIHKIIITTYKTRALLYGIFKVHGRG